MNRFIGTTCVAWAFACIGAVPALADDGGDAARGQRLFLQCSACHSLQPTPGTLGPPLGGIVGRKAAAADGYVYSAALSGANLEWNEATLDRWLEHPTAIVPGTKMIFAGVNKPVDRLAIIAYLKTTRAPGAK